MARARDQECGAAEGEHGGAEREHEGAEKEQRDETVSSAGAKRRRLSQPGRTCCTQFGDYIYIYIILDVENVIVLNSMGTHEGFFWGVWRCVSRCRARW